MSPVHVAVGKSIKNVACISKLQNSSTNKALDIQLKRHERNSKTSNRRLYQIIQRI